MLVRGYDVAKGESNSIDHPLCGKVTQTTLHLRKNRLNDKMLIQVIGNVDKYGCDYQSRLRSRSFQYISIVCHSPPSSSSSS